MLRGSWGCDVVENIKISYAAASVIPAKVIMHEGVREKIKVEGKVMPVHLQLNPTNRCNLNCDFCSCSDREKNLELSYDDVEEIMRKSCDCGCGAVTITGGGEPLMHDRIREIVSMIDSLGIEIGLVTNGLLLDRFSNEFFSKLVWCRISSGDDRYLDKGYVATLEDAVDRGRNVDWAFSHVISRNPNYDTIADVIEFANKHDFTHVRLVSDLLDLDNVPSMNLIREEMVSRGVNDERVNYQGRKEYIKGSNNCYISLLKPVVGADGYLYPCCGVQYSLEKPSRDYEKTMRMGLAKDINKLYEQQKFFDGSVCSKCYYGDYNSMLEILLSEIKHKKFV